MPHVITHLAATQYVCDVLLDVRLRLRCYYGTVRLMLQGKNDEKSTVKPTEGRGEQGILPQGLMRLFPGPPLLSRSVANSH